MEIRINSVNFDATEKLQEFIYKKCEKLQKSYGDIQKVEVQLKVVKPATAQNKQTSIALTLPGSPIFIEKTCDTFEQGIDDCVASLRVKLAKIKEKSRNL